MVSLLLCLPALSALRSQTQDSGKDEKFAELVLQAFDKENKHDLPGALEDYSKALQLKNDSATILIRKAYIESKLGQYIQAGRDLKSASGCQPVSVTDYLTVAWMRATCPFSTFRDGPLAVSFAQKALREQPSPEAYDMLAAGYAEMHNFSKAEENIRSALKLFPDSPRVPDLKARLALYQTRKPWREVWGEDEKKQSAQMQKAEKQP